jgi:predicted metal-dependent hydrolase
MIIHTNTLTDDVLMEVLDLLEEGVEYNEIDIDDKANEDIEVNTEKTDVDRLVKILQLIVPEPKFKEEWKTVKGFKKVEDGEYQVSNYGEVRNKLTKEVLHKKVSNKHNQHPYYSVHLLQNTGKREWFLVHQIVAHAFVKVPKKYENGRKLVVDHLDNNGLNNHYDNLSWKTIAENTRASYQRHDYINRDSHNIDVKNNPDVLKAICKQLETPKPYKMILADLGFDVTPGNVTLLKRINYGQTATGLTTKYNFYNGTRSQSGEHYDIFAHVKLIKGMIIQGYENGEICDLIWPILKKSTRKSRVRTIHRIREGKIYTDINLTDEEKAKYENNKVR